LQSTVAASPNLDNNARMRKPSPSKKARRPSKATKPSVSKSRASWVGGAYPVPVDLPNAPSQPWVVLWIDPDHQWIVGHGALPCFDPEAVVQSFREAVAHPKMGPPGLPASVRVSNPEVAAALRADGAVQVIEAPTPEADFIADQFFAAALPPDPTMNQVPTAMTAAFFQAAAEVYRARPWDQIPSDSAILLLSSEALGLSDAAVSVIGQSGESHGLLLFDDTASFLGFSHAAMSGARPEELFDHMPFQSLTFMPSEEYPSPLARQIRSNRWEIAGPNAMPLLMRHEGGRPRQNDAVDVVRAIVVCKGLLGLMRKHPQLRRTWTDGQPFETIVTVDMAGEHLETKWKAPAGGVESFAHRRPEPARKPATRSPTSKPVTYQLRVELDHTEPKVWRTVLVPGDILLSDLHHVIQLSFGWQESHMHTFLLKNRRSTRSAGFGVDGMFDEDEEQGENEDEICLSDVAPRARSKLGYVYDFGDSWYHTIVVEKVHRGKEQVDAPVCTGGEMACPPEDCGGVDGYYHLLDALNDPAHPEHEEFMDWLEGEFDPCAFHLEAVNRRLSTAFSRR
jgi:hypothetical protein